MTQLMAILNAPNATLIQPAPNPRKPRKSKPQLNKFLKLYVAIVVLCLAMGHFPRADGAVLAKGTELILKNI